MRVSDLGSSMMTHASFGFQFVVVDDRRSGHSRRGGPWIDGTEVLRVRDFRGNREP